MVAAVALDQIQLGSNGTSTNNFVIQTLNDGSMKIQRGNIGGTLTDVLTIDSTGRLTQAWEIDVAQRSLTTNGYQRLGNGLLLQWGTSTITAPSSSISFPVAFPVACLNITASDLSAVGNLYTLGVDSYTTTQFVARTSLASGTDSFRWFAIGK